MRRLTEKVGFIFGGGKGGFVVVAVPGPRGAAAL